MAVRRKSNWYIYFIAFGITMAFVFMVILTFRWYLFPEKTESAGLTSAGELSDSFSPTAEHSFTMLTMLSEASSDMPELFVLAAYDAVESRLTFIPIPAGISMASEGRNLPNVYAAQGGEGVISAIQNAAGVKCDCYVKFDRASFTDFISSYGNVRYDVPKTIIIVDGIEADTLNAGSQYFTSEKLYRYIMLAEFDEGESYRFNIIGSVISELVNQNFSNADSSLLDTYAQLIMNAPESSVTYEEYMKRKAALLNTIMYATSPAEYYVPYGVYSDDGGFIISENSITTIRQKTGQD